MKQYELAFGLFVEAKFIADRVSKRRKCPHVRPNVCTRRQNLTARLFNLLECIRNAVHHDVYACLLVWSSIGVLDPSTTHGPCIVKGQVAVPTRTNFPTKDARIKLG